MAGEKTTMKMIVLVIITGFAHHFGDHHWDHVVILSGIMACLPPITLAVAG